MTQRNRQQEMTSSRFKCLSVCLCNGWYWSMWKNIPKIFCKNWS